MPKEDYLIKFLEKLGRVVAAMLGFREKGFPDDSLRVADEMYKELLHLDIHTLSSMPLEKYVKIVAEGNYSASYLEGLAELTYQTAKSFSDKSDTQAANSFYEKSLQAYYLLNEKDKTFSFERERIISDLEKIIQK